MSAADEMELWTVALDDEADNVEHWERELLSDKERRRAEKFAFAEGRRRFVAGRAILRQILANKLGVDPVGLRFGYGPFGKPALADPGHGEWHFNVSHADGWALIVVGRAGRLGVDIERVQTISEWDDIAGNCFPPEDRERLRALGGDDHDREFIRLWTRREALLKALGWGWTGPALKSRAPFAPALTVEQAPAPEGYLAALAHGADSVRLIPRRWE